MSKKLPMVAAGTNTQGLSLVNATFKGGASQIRALTRNPSNEKAEKLRARGIVMVRLPYRRTNLSVGFQRGNSTKNQYNSIATHITHT
jgi:hypothetical protein